MVSDGVTGVGSSLKPSIVGPGPDSVSKAANLVPSAKLNDESSVMSDRLRTDSPIGKMDTPKVGVLLIHTVKNGKTIKRESLLTLVGTPCGTEPVKCIVASGEGDPSSTASDGTIDLGGSRSVVPSMGGEDTMV